ncbi:hypothetical protein PoB_007393800 [Plakobranchus ocellatus]|uniref:BZIP domain-containing protein n=1 Tax=Plakobranchus ocellatus TaxID=259542 RepID=A0AAV4DT04_9GAST|nr:hypothetical protein PoB_007393800 [Plakobranchus ocellatus]
MVEKKTAVYLFLFQSELRLRESTISRNADNYQRQSGRCKCPSETGKKRPAGAVKVKKSPGTVQGLQMPAGSSAQLGAAVTTCYKLDDADSTSIWRGVVSVSPLEMFYHSYVAPYDNRGRKKESQDGMPTLAGSSEKKRAVKGSAQHGKKKDRDNTIGSVDSIGSEDALVEHSGDYPPHEGASAAGSKATEVKGKQAVDDAAKRLGKDEDGGLGDGGQNSHAESASKDQSKEASCSLKRPVDDKEHRFNKTSGCEPSLQANHNFSSVAKNIDESDDRYEDELNDESRERETKTFSPVTSGFDTSSSTDALTMSISNKNTDNGCRAFVFAHQSANVDAQVDNSLINMKKSQDKVSVSGKYSQVVVVHGHNQNIASRSHTADAGCSSTAPQEGAHSHLNAEDFTVPHGRHLSFNICGENVYITVGAKKSKIKACRKKNSVRSQSSGKASENASCTGKKKKLKKKIIKKAKPVERNEAAQKYPVETRSQDKDVNLAESVWSNELKNEPIDNIQEKVSDPYKAECQRLENKPCGLGDTDITSKERSKSEVKSILCGVDGEYDDDDDDYADGTTANGSAKNAELTAMVSPGSCHGGEESNDYDCPRARTYESNVVEIPNLNPSLVEAIVQDCPDGEICVKGEAEESYVFLTLDCTERRPEPEGQEMGEDEAMCAGMGTNPLSAEMMRISVPGPQHQDQYTYPLDIVESIQTAYTTRERSSNPEITVFVPGDGGDVYINGPPSNSTNIESQLYRGSGPYLEQVAYISQGECSANINEREANHGYGRCEDGQGSKCAGGGGGYVGVNTTPTTSGLYDTLSGTQQQDTRSLSRGGSGLSHPSGLHGTGQTNDVLTDDANANDVEDNSNEGGNEVRTLVGEAGFIDVFALKRSWQTENRCFKRQINKFRERSRHVAHLQQLIAQLGRETCEMRRMLENLHGQTTALKNEAADMRCTLSAVCDVSVTDLLRTTEARSLEPACYRRYINIRTPLDAANLLSAVRNRIKALGELEILVYRKQLVLHHVLPGSAQDCAPGPKVRSLRHYTLAKGKTKQGVLMAHRLVNPQ